MSRDVSSFAPELAAWSRNFDDFAAVYQQMSKRLKELDQKLQESTAELNHEVETRKNWMKRANAAENRIKQQQFILVLIDGNQSCFKDDIIRSGATGAEGAVQSLIAEVHETAKSRHKNDLASDLHVLVHLFVDIDRLAGDLVSAGSLSSRQQLEEFFKALSDCNPLLSVTDCRSGRKSVDAKMRDHYELFIENVQCRHIILALGLDSEYYSTLDMYSEDAYTLSKTSLLRTIHGFPPKYNLPFHQVKFTTLDTVPLISLELDHVEPETSVGRGSSKDIEPIDESLIPEGPRSAGSSAHPSHSQQPQGSGTGSSSRSAGSGSGTGRQGSPISSQTSHAASKKSERWLAPEVTSPRSNPSPIVGHPPQPGTYEASIASYEHEWERLPGQNTYSAPAIIAPWGQEPDFSESIDDPYSSTRVEEPEVPRKCSASVHQHRASQQPRWKEKPAPKPLARKVQSGPPRTGSVSFQGSWDELVSGKIDAVPPIAASISSSLQPSGPDPLPELPIQCDVALNHFGDRIDQPLPRVLEADRNRLRARIQVRKLCNEHHLRRACHNEQCRYDHEPIDAGMLLALRHLARTQACDIGPACRLSECPHGHHCPSRDGGRDCNNSKCSFKKKGMHHIRDLKVVEVLPAKRK